MSKGHVEESEHGRMCRHCLSTVDADGYALGEAEEFAPHEGDVTEQQASTEAMRDNAGASFADAVRRAPGYAEGGMVEDESEKQLKRLGIDDAADAVESPFDSAKKAMEEMKRRKMERYGRMGR